MPNSKFLFILLLALCISSVSIYSQEYLLQQYVNNPSSSCKMVPVDSEYSDSPQDEESELLGLQEGLIVDYMIPSTGKGNTMIREGIVRVGSFRDAQTIARELDTPLVYDALKKIVIVELEREYPDEQTRYEEYNREQVLAVHKRVMMELQADLARIKKFNLQIVDKNGTLLDKAEILSTYDVALASRVEKMEKVMLEGGYHKYVYGMTYQGFINLLEKY